MPKYVFDKCCGCIELKSGCLIIGYLTVVGSFVMIILSALALAAGATLMGKDVDPKFHFVGLILVIVMAILIILLIVNFAFAITLLVGLHKNKPGHLKAYMIYTVVFLVLMLLNLLVSLVNYNPRQVIQTIIYLIITTYFLLVIRSQYYVMKGRPTGPAVYSA